MKDLTGSRFGNLTVVTRAENIGRRVAWLCKCDCGEEVIIKSANLLRKDSPTRNCGCNQKNKFVDITGQKFGKLTAMKFVRIPGQPSKWLCQCECGNTVLVYRQNLRRGTTTSCGCSIHETPGHNTKHKMHGTRLYSIWCNMRTRCKDKDNPFYGGKGITVCQDWESPENFFKWAMESGYSESLTIDRINSNKGYSPDNCRWVDKEVQANNISKNVRIEHDGEIHTMSEWSKILELDYKRFHRALKYYQMDFETAVLYAKGTEKQDITKN